MELCNRSTAAAVCRCSRSISTSVIFCVLSGKAEKAEGPRTTARWSGCSRLRLKVTMLSFLQNYIGISLAYLGSVVLRLATRSHCQFATGEPNKLTGGGPAGASPRTPRHLLSPDSASHPEPPSRTGRVVQQRSGGRRRRRRRRPTIRRRRG